MNSLHLRGAKVGWGRDILPVRTSAKGIGYYSILACISSRPSSNSQLRNSTSLSWNMHACPVGCLKTSLKVLLSSNEFSYVFVPYALRAIDMLSRSLPPNSSNKFHITASRIQNLRPLLDTRMPLQETEKVKLIRNYERPSRNKDWALIFFGRYHPHERGILESNEANQRRRGDN